MKTLKGNKRVKIYDQEGLELLAKQLVKLRGKQDFSQHDLADVAGLPRSQIARIETCRTNPSASTLFKIARALKIKPAELFDFDLSDNDL